MTAYADIPISGGDTAAPRSLKTRVAKVGQYLRPGDRRFLDCGCGSGDYVLALRRLGLDAFGVEYLPEKVEAAHRVPELRDLVWRGDLQALDVPDGTFDAAMLNEVLEHVPSDVAALREVHRVLRPNGRLIILSPSRLYPFETHGVALKRSGRTVPPWTPFVPYVPLRVGSKIFDYWARNYWPGELRRMAERCGFRLAATDVVWQTFENISGQQPRLVAKAKPLLQELATSLERMPGIRRFGVSQVLVLDKA